MLRFSPVIFVILFPVISFAAGFSGGSIKGKVVTRDSKEILIGATVLLNNTSSGTVTGPDGEFILSGIEGGMYNLTVRFVGYKNQIKTDVLVTPNKVTNVIIEMVEDLYSTEDVTVNAGYFGDRGSLAINAVAFNTEEIKRSPGSANDVSRILMVLPSTAKVDDNSNDLAVRGGSPAENGFYIDNIPVPNINHFPNQGSTGGPIGLLNIDFIDNIDFYVSGFSSSFGDRLSSVVNIKFREGSKENYYGKAFISFAGYGVTAEGPVVKNKASFMVSASKSYLDLIVDAIGTGAAPRYSDVHFKSNYDISEKHKLSLLNLFGESSIEFDKQTAIDQKQKEYGKNWNYQNTTGMNWLGLWSNNFYSNTSLAYSVASFNADFMKVYDASKVLSAGNMEKNLTLRNVNFFKINNYNKIEFGAEFKNETGVFDYSYPSDTTSLGTINTPIDVSKNVVSNKTGAFLQYSSMLWEDFNINIGLRGDYYNLNKQTEVSPRIEIGYKLSPVAKININGGILYQQLPVILLSGDERYKSLPNLKSSYYGAGFEYLLTADTRLTLDVYNKDYSQMPLDPGDPARSVMEGGLFRTRFTRYTDLVSTGTGYTRGAELMIQKKMAEDLYGLISASYYRSRYRDYNGVWRDRIYDNKVILSAIGGYKLNREWEFSVRWTYGGGVPYTPFDETLSAQYNVGVLDQNQVNSKRQPAYHTLNFRVDRKYYFNNQYLNIYLSLMNAYNRKNVSQYVWNPIDRKVGTVYQWSVMPVFGLEYEM